MTEQRVAADNEEALEAWNGPLFERFVRFRDTITTGLATHGAEALRTEIALRRFDAPILGGRDLDEAIELVMALGPGGEVLRMLGDRADHAPVDRVLAARGPRRIRARRRAGLRTVVDVGRHGSSLTGSVLSWLTNGDSTYSAAPASCIRG
jgi:hypothetical protein